MDSESPYQQPPLDEADEETTTRRTFVKTGATLTGGLLLTGVYSKPSMQSINLGILPNPSSPGSGTSPKLPKEPKEPKEPKKSKEPKNSKKPGNSKKP